jgi:tRNA(adenine34) deaminase
MTPRIAIVTIFFPFFTPRPPPPIFIIVRKKLALLKILHVLSGAPMEKHFEFMDLALKGARQAARLGEVPVGAVTVRAGEILSQAHNLRETENLPTAHAELLAIDAASARLGSWRLENCILYVTLEPCLMCWGAIVLARVPEVYFGAYDAKAGVCGSVLSLHQETRFNHHPRVQGGIRAEECGKILSEFFGELRNRKGARVVEEACLESMCAGNRTEGSNPSPSAKSKLGRILRVRPAIK